MTHDQGAWWLEAEAARAAAELVEDTADAEALAETDPQDDDRCGGVNSWDLL